MKNQLALFDFDGTLTTRDSMLEFLKFSVGTPRLLLAAAGLAPKIIAYFFAGKRDGEQVKALLFTKLFAGTHREDLENLGKKFYQQKMPALLRADLMLKLEQFKNEGATLALVSASLDFWLRPFAEAHGMTLICTEIGYDGGVFNGRFATANCNFEEKARRVRAAFDLEKFERVFAFGNSAGDSAMFSLADEHFLVR